MFCLQPLIPKIPTIILAVIPIPEDLKADDLIVYSWKVITGLLDLNIQVISYATDGGTVERSVQRKVEALATCTKTISFKHPAHEFGLPDLVIPIRFYGEDGKHPLAIVQDPKHCSKTFRNNSASGAQILTLPNHVVYYAQIRDMSLGSDAPLYRRDVEKSDRQDDNAATRLFSRRSLEWVTEHYPER